jgi:hypothetical protein
VANCTYVDMRFRSFKFFLGHGNYPFSLTVQIKLLKNLFHYRRDDTVGRLGILLKLHGIRGTTLGRGT